MDSVQFHPSCMLRLAVGVEDGESNMRLAVGVEHGESNMRLAVGVEHD